MIRGRAFFPVAAVLAVATLTVTACGDREAPVESPDGKRLAIGRLDRASNARDIWVLDLVRGVSSRFTFDKADDTNPLWSPDGSRIVATVLAAKAAMMAELGLEVHLCGD